MPPSKKKPRRRPDGTPETRTPDEMLAAAAAHEKWPRLELLPTDLRQRLTAHYRACTPRCGSASFRDNSTAATGRPQQSAFN